MHCFLRTNNPRPTFHLDMTDEERATMSEHVAYWTERAKEGIAIVFGPVADAGGFYGIAVCEVDDEEQMRRIVDADPANGLLSYEISPMAVAVVGHEHRTS